MYLSVKSFFDKFISAVALVVLSPVLLVIAIAIKINSPGSVLFKQGRVGKNGKAFAMYKFRSMVQDAEKQGTGLFNYEGDPRVTKVGRFLRDTSLDELPQLFNVVKGDMSIIGPRPSVTYELGDYETLNNRYKKRFLVLPGITGLAQVSGRNDVDWDEKINYDNKYVDLLKKDGLKTDLAIIIKTLLVVLKKQDIYENKNNQNINDEDAAKLAAEEVIRKAHERDKGDVLNGRYQ